MINAKAETLEEQSLELKGKTPSDRRFMAGMLTPLFVIFIAGIALPILFGFFISIIFSSGKTLFGSFAGLNNFSSFLDPTRLYATTFLFYPYFYQTVFFVLISVSIELILGMVFALMLNRNFRGRGFSRASLLVPWALPTVVSAVMFKEIFAPTQFFGVVNSFFQMFGLKPIAFYGDPGVNFGVSIIPIPSSVFPFITFGTMKIPFAMLTILVIEVWKTTPFIALLILAALQTVPEDLYKAADIEGASSWEKFRYVTWPLIRGPVIIAVIFRVIDAVRVYDSMVTINDSNLKSITMIAVEVWQSPALPSNFGVASAIAIVELLMIGVFVLLVIKMDKNKLLMLIAGFFLFYERAFFLIFDVIDFVLTDSLLAGLMVLIFLVLFLNYFIRHVKVLSQAKQIHYLVTIIFTILVVFGDFLFIFIGDTMIAALFSIFAVFIIILNQVFLQITQQKAGDYKVITINYQILKNPENPDSELKKIVKVVIYTAILAIILFFIPNITKGSDQIITGLVLIAIFALYALQMLMILTSKQQIFIEIGKQQFSIIVIVFLIFELISLLINELALFVVVTFCAILYFNNLQKNSFIPTIARETKFTITTNVSTLKRERFIGSIGFGVLVLAFLSFCLAPFIWMIDRSLRDPCFKVGDQCPSSAVVPIQKTFELIPKYLSIQSYSIVLNSQYTNFIRVLINGFLLSGATAIVVIIVASFVAAVLAKYHLPYENYFVLLIFSMSSLPPIIIIIPYVLQTQILAGYGINLQGQLYGLLLPYVAFNLPLGVFLLRSFFQQIPDELIKAAKVDGASNFQTFRKILLPLTKPGIFTSGIMVFIQAWNELLFAQIFLSSNPSNWTAPLAILQFNRTGTAIAGIPWTSSIVLMSASVIATLPLVIVVLILQKQIISGITSGAVKG